MSVITTNSNDYYIKLILNIHVRDLSKSIANFEFPRVMYIRFSIFYGIMLVLTYIF